MLVVGARFGAGPGGTLSETDGAGALAEGAGGTSALEEPAAGGAPLVFDEPAGDVVEALAEPTGAFADAAGALGEAFGAAPPIFELFVAEPVCARATENEKRAATNAIVHDNAPWPPDA